MKRLATIIALWLALAGLASAQQILTSSPVYTAASSPPLVLYVANFSEFNVALTANAQIKFSLPTVAPNSIPFRVNFCQDATGGWQPTFSTVTGATIVNRVGASNVSLAANACSTQFWTFRAATNQVILMGTSPFTGSGTFTSITASVNNVINVMAPPYNVLGDDATDAQPGVQQAIWDSTTAGVPFGTCTTTSHRPVYFPTPAIAYFFQSPIRITCPNFEIFGLNHARMDQRYFGYKIIQMASGLTGLTYGPSLVNGCGGLSTTCHSLVSSNVGAVGPAIDLALMFDNSTSTNGVGFFQQTSSTGYNISLFMTPLANSGSAGQIMGSRKAYPSSGDGAYKFILDSSQKVEAFVETSGGEVNLNSASCATQAAGTVYETEIDWDKSTYRLWQGVAGTISGSTFTPAPQTAVLCASAASSNATVITPFEDMTLPNGGPFQFWPEGSSQGTNAFSGNIDGIQFYKTSLHTAAYTTPTTKPITGPAPISDSNQFYVNNFIASPDGEQIANVFGSYSTVYHNILQNNIGGTAKVSIHGLELCDNSSNAVGNAALPDALYVAGGNDGKAYDNSCSFGSFIPANMYNNDFNYTWSDNAISGGMAGMSAANAWNDSYSTNNAYDQQAVTCVQISGGGGSPHYDNHTKCTDRGGLYYHDMENQSNGVITDWVDDQEAGNTHEVAALLLDSPNLPYAITGGIFSPGSTGTHVLQDGGGVGAIFNGTIFPLFGSPPDVIKFTGTAPTAMTRFNDVGLPTGIPISNLPQYVSLDGTSKVTFAQLNTITCPTAGLAPDGAQGWLVTNDTTCTTGSLVDAGGTTYCTALCKSGVGFVH